MKAKHEDPRYFQTYIEYAKVLRTWLVAYGIGAPALILTNEKLTTKLLSHPEIKFIGIAFLIGVILQIALAFTNKIIMWLCYYGECVEKVFKKSLLYKYALKISSQFWIDILFDIASIFLFSYATLKLFNLLMK